MNKVLIDSKRTYKKYWNDKIKLDFAEHDMVLHDLQKLSSYEMRKYL